MKVKVSIMRKFTEEICIKGKLMFGGQLGFKVMVEDVNQSDQQITHWCKGEGCGRKHLISLVS